MKLDDRLAAVAEQIQSTTHVDIGSDHGSLLVALLNQDRIKFGIAVENKQRPFDNSVRALAGLPAEVRLGDGLNPIEIGEADSLSICGMGAESIRDILLAHPDRIPDRVILQVYHKPELVRGWAIENDFHLIHESVTRGKRCYTILTFGRSENPQASDPAYEDVDRESALLFGPFVLKRQDRQFDIQLQDEEAWWRKFDRLSDSRTERLKLLRRMMADRGIEPLPGDA